MANKTKAELLKDIEELQMQLCDKERELLKFKEIEACANMGEEYKLIYDNYINAGFTKEEAFTLLQITVDRTINDFMRDVRSQTRRSYNPYRRY